MVAEFTAEPKASAELDRFLVLADEVMRHKIIRVPGRRRRPGPGPRLPPGPRRPPGDAARSPAEPAASGGRDMANGNNIALVGQHHPGPRAALHAHGPGHGHLRAGREPAVAEPPDPGVGGGHVVLRRGVLARDGRERRGEPGRGLAGDRHRPPRAAVVGDPGRRQALQGRGRGRRDRPQPALGHRPGDQERAPRPGRRRAAPRRRRRRAAARRPGGRRAATATTRSPSEPWRGHTERIDPARRPRRRRDAVTKTPCALCRDKVEWVDYKDVALLRQLHERPGQDPRPPGDGELRPAPGRGRHGHQDGARARAPAHARDRPAPAARQSRSRRRARPRGGR